MMHNISEMVEEKKGMSISRIPESLRVTLNKSACEKAKASAGSEMRFNLGSREARITLACPGLQEIAEVFQGNFRTSVHHVSDKPCEIKVSLPANIGVLKNLSREHKMAFDAGLTRVILPYREVRIFDVEGDFELPRRGQVPGLTCLAYGSSITHGASAVSPSGTYIMRTAERLGVDLINLGFGGGAHFESGMADYIAGRKDWDFASFEIGINMVSGFEVEEFRKRVEYFINRVAKSHPGKYIFCTDIFSYREDFAGTGSKHKSFRKVVKDAVKGVGSEKVIHLDGRKLLTDIKGLTSDLVHPAPQGMEEISLNLSKSIGKRMKM